jgi:hypothetical protein
MYFSVETANLPEGIAKRVLLPTETEDAIARTTFSTGRLSYIDGEGTEREYSILWKYIPQVNDKGEDVLVPEKKVVWEEEPFGPGYFPQLAKSIVEGVTPKYMWRKLGCVLERAAWIGDVQVLESYEWSGKDAFFLNHRVELTRCEFFGKDGPQQLPTGKFYDGYGPDETSPQPAVEQELMKLTIGCLQDAEILASPYRSRAFAYTIMTDDEDGCEHCQSHLCEWLNNKDIVVRDNDFIYFQPYFGVAKNEESATLNKKRRYTASRQLAFYLHGWRVGPTMKLPKCCLQGIADQWPDPNEESVGHKDT